MSTSDPGHRRIGDRRPDDDGAMETFTVPLPRTLFVRLFGRNPLVRVTDRVEGLMLVLVVIVSLIAVPISAAVGTAVHDSRSRTYAEQVQTRSPVTATVTGDSHPRRDLESPTVTVPARWIASGAERTGDVIAPLTAKIGDNIEIWVDGEGHPVARPVNTARTEAVAFAAATWWAMSLMAVALFARARITLDRLRYDQWQQSFDRLVERR
ncbi:Rv1733c family protein [Mycobacterium heidelbergense]|uniref:Rv1733c family protein n=1 Tax=Mycobacterium heidelbergense TaxID=53376 RepID=UPI003CEA59B3